VPIVPYVVQFRIMPFNHKVLLFLSDIKKGQLEGRPKKEDFLLCTYVSMWFN